MKRQFLLLLTGLFMSMYSYAQNAASGEDLTHLVGVTAEDWHAGGMVGWAAPQVTTRDGRTTALAEMYHEPADVTGTVMGQILTGLPRGSYQVKLYANTLFTSGRGFDSDVAEGQTDVVYVFANGTRRYIPVHIGETVGQHGEYTMECSVTDGTLHLGMTAAKAGTNWHSMQIKSLGRTGDVSGGVKGDVNLDGNVDVADIASGIDIMADGGQEVTGPGYFYFGTTQPTADNYKTLPGVVTTYTTIDEAVGATATVAAGQTVYMLCPAAWMNEKNVALEDKDGNSIDFLEEKDDATISGYVIYKSQVWNAPNDVVLKTEIIDKWYIGVSDPYNFTTIGQKNDSNLDVWFNKTSTIRGSVSDEINWDTHYWYVAAPSSWNATIYDFTNGATFIDVVYSSETRTKIIGGVEYTIWKSIAQTTDTSLCLHM